MMIFGRGTPSSLAFAALLTAAACTTQDVGSSGSEFATLTVSGTLRCDRALKNKKTAGATQDTYSCVGGTYPGGEWVQQLNPTQDGDIVVSVGDYDGYPMVVILRETGSGIENAECVVGNWYSVRFTATAGETYYVVVDSDGTVPFVTFDVEAFCTAQDTEQNCSDGMDDDQDWLFDCADPDCDEACNPVTCSPYTALSCGDTLVAGDTFSFGSTDIVDEYGTCPADRVANSPERTYTFDATSDGYVNFTLSNFSAYPMLFVLEDDGSGCNSNRCIAHNYYSVNFYAEAGNRYYLVADGAGENPYLFDASVVCDPPPTEVDCTNDIDEDGDGTIDCEDTDCENEPACQSGGECTPVAALDCSSALVPGDTASPEATNSINSYSCNPDLDLTTSEMAYQIGPFSQNEQVVVTLSNESSYGVISIVEESGSGCGPDTCVAQNYYSVRFTARRNRTYYAVIEADFAPSITYDISVVCDPPASETGAECSDDIDNDGDGLADCEDPDDCTTECAAQSDVCEPAYALDCNSFLVPGSTASPAASNAAESYGCYPAETMSGNEFTYQFVAPRTEPVLFTLSDETDYAAIAVLEHDNVCDPENCSGFQYYSVVTNVVAGQTYDIVVDGMNPGTLDYRISVLCNPGTEEVDCNDGVDNDGDFLIDSDDETCP